MSAPDEGTVLERRTVNRTLLARQFLLERVEERPADLVEHLVGLQAQVPFDPYVALWSRLRAFDPDAFGGELVERHLVRMTLMRATLHLVSSADALRVRPLLQGMLERAFQSSPFARTLAGLELAPVLARGAELVEEKPLTVSQLGAALSADWPGFEANALACAVRYLVPLVQVTPRGVWGARMQPTVTTLTGWLGRRPHDGGEVDEFVLRYLRAFGPASTADIRTWSWLSDVRSIVARLRPQLRVYRDESGRDLYDVADGLFADPSASAPVRFLPQYDNVFLSHADRARIMDTVIWGTSFTHRGSLLVDGFLAGAWKLTEQKPDATLTIELRTRVRRGERAEIGQEAERLLAFLTPEARSRHVHVHTE